MQMINLKVTRIPVMAESLRERGLQRAPGECVWRRAEDKGQQFGVQEGRVIWGNRKGTWVDLCLVASIHLAKKAPSISAGLPFSLRP